MIRYLLILLIVTVLVGGLYFALERRRVYPSLPNLNISEGTSGSLQSLDNDLTAMERDLLELEQMNASFSHETQDL